MGLLCCNLKTFKSLYKISSKPSFGTSKLAASFHFQTLEYFDNVLEQLDSEKGSCSSSGSSPREDGYTYPTEPSKFQDLTSIFCKPPYRKSSIKPLGGLFNFGPSRGGGLIERGLLERGAYLKKLKIFGKF